MDECIRTRREGPSKVNHELGVNVTIKGVVLNNPCRFCLFVIDLPYNIVTQANLLPFIRPFNWSRGWVQFTLTSRKWEIIRVVELTD